MPYKRKQTGNFNFGTGVGFGIAVSVFLSVLLAMLLTTMVLNERAGECTIEYAVPVIAFVSSLAGSVVAGKMAREKVAILAGVTGAAYILILIGMGILFFDGGFHNLWSSLLSVVAGCVVSCAICIRGGRSGSKRKRVYR